MKIFRISDPDEFIEEYKAGKQKYFTVGHELLIAQLVYEIMCTEKGFYKLPRLEKQAKIIKYQECIDLVKADQAEKNKK